MRPNIDIPWSIHGEVKEYSESHDITLEDAYIEILEEGVDKVEFTGGTIDSFEMREKPGEKFGPEDIHSSENTLNTLITQLGYVDEPHQPVVFHSYQRSMSHSELEKAFRQFAGQFTVKIRDYFTLNQEGGSWFGTGIENFLNSVKNAEERINNAEFSTYGTEPALYMASIDDENLFCLYLESHEPDYDKVRNVKTGFMANGHPVQPEKYERYASAFGFSSLTNSRDVDCFEIQRNLDVDIELTPIKKITFDEHSEVNVGGLVVENPFTENPDLCDAIVNEVEETIDDSESDPYYRRISKDDLQQNDSLFVQLENWHKMDEDYPYYLKSAKITDLSRMVDRKRTFNINLRADWPAKLLD